MAANGLFDAVAEALEAGSSLDRLEARGTLRIALKNAGLESEGLTSTQMQVVLKRVLPAELDARGIDGAADLCETLVDFVDSIGDSEDVAATDTPEDVFRRVRGEAP